MEDINAGQSDSDTWSWQGCDTLDIFILQHCIKSGYINAASELRAEANISSDLSPPIDARQGFLFELWSTFWTLYQTQRGESACADARIYVDHQKAAQRRWHDRAHEHYIQEDQAEEVIPFMPNVQGQAQRLGSLDPSSSYTLDAGQGSNPQFHTVPDYQHIQGAYDFTGECFGPSVSAGEAAMWPKDEPHLPSGQSGNDTDFYSIQDISKPCASALVNGPAALDVSQYGGPAVNRQQQVLYEVIEHASGGIPSGQGVQNVYDIGLGTRHMDSQWTTQTVSPQMCELMDIEMTLGNEGQHNQAALDLPDNCIQNAIHNGVSGIPATLSSLLYQQFVNYTLPRDSAGHDIAGMDASLVHQQLGPDALGVWPRAGINGVSQIQDHNSSDNIWMPDILPDLSQQPAGEITGQGVFSLPVPTLRPGAADIPWSSALAAYDSMISKNSENAAASFELDANQMSELFPSLDRTPSQFDLGGDLQFEESVERLIK
ncbi:hypothetical protein AcV7_003114 [Taiwanofungus camphoratus]|nr:hypothetical protein AcV7_003114 [Antrodia cinnamomea]